MGACVALVITFMTALQHPCQGILAAPLIMGNDLRTMSPGSKEILQNRMAVQINQDPLGTAGTRISEFGQTEIWARALQARHATPNNKTANP